MAKQATGANPLTPTDSARIAFHAVRAARLALQDPKHGRDRMTVRTAASILADAERHLRAILEPTP